MNAAGEHGAGTGGNEGSLALEGMKDLGLCCRAGKGVAIWRFAFPVKQGENPKLPPETLTPETTRNKQIMF